MINKKGMHWGIGVGIVAVLVLVAVVMFAKGGFASSVVSSLSSKTNNYNVKNCPDLAVVMDGNVNVQDTGVLTLNPSLNAVTLDTVRVDGNELCLICSESDFTYTVKAVDATSNTILNTFKGTGTLKSDDNKGINKAYSLYFKVPDFDCNRRIDDFNVQIVAELKSNDIGDDSIQDMFIKVRNGAVLK